MSFMCKSFLKELNFELFLKNVNWEKDVGKASQVESAGKLTRERNLSPMCGQQVN